jgi:hypothetical protein
MIIIQPFDGVNENSKKRKMGAEAPILKILHTTYFYELGNNVTQIDQNRLDKDQVVNNHFTVIIRAVSQRRA